MRVDDASVTGFKSKAKRVGMDQPLLAQSRKQRCAEGRVITPRSGAVDHTRDPDIPSLPTISNSVSDIEIITTRGKALQVTA